MGFEVKICTSTPNVSPREGGGISVEFYKNKQTNKKNNNDNEIIHEENFNK